ncbi:hypothetical protein Q3G72_031988 [Acer saccharum]|nr:hypothetical protein Q3G72_031988 [Acer saccharum]
MFVFSAQQAAEMNEIVKEKPPDPISNAKRARAQEELDENVLRNSDDSFKSKLVGTMNPGSWSGFGTGHSKDVYKEGEEQQNKATVVPDTGEESVNGNDPFGPWMQVSYGRNGRNNGGVKNFGKKSGHVGNSSGVGSVSKVNASNRINEIRKIDVVKNGPSKSGVNNGAKIQGNGKVGGSRFEILNEVLEENVDVTKEQFHVYKQKIPDAGKVLSDISNRGKTTNEQLSSHANKFLVVNQDRFNKPFKVNGKREGSGSIGKGYKGGKQSGKVVVSQQEGMEDVLEDSDVLKALHQDMLDSGLSNKDAGESSMETIGDSEPAVCVERVDVPNASNFDEVASKLKEAMEIAME